jgi:hypothetical protein
MGRAGWFSIVIAPGRADALSALQNDFFQAWADVGAPKRVAMFLARKPRCPQAAWFTPETGRYLGAFLASHGAIECAAPERFDSFLVGHDDDRKRVRIGPR